MLRIIFCAVLVDGNEDFLDKITCEDGGKGASRALRVVILYDDLAAGQRAMHLCRELTRQREGDLSLQPQRWRLDLVYDPVCGGFASARNANPITNWVRIVQKGGGSHAGPPPGHTAAAAAPFWQAMKLYRKLCSTN